MGHVLERILEQYGLLAVFVISMFEGDVILVLAGVSSHLGFFTPLEAWIVAWTGLLTGDCGWYSLGRTLSARIQSTSFYQRMKPKIQFLSGKYGAWEILAARFVYGTRTVSMIYWGVRKLKFLHFFLFDFVGCILWATLLIALGYFLSQSAAAIIGKVKRIEIWLLAALLLSAVFFVCRRYFAQLYLRKSKMDYR
jgi:membrane protein DedA with SNARE-associated domain